MLSYSYLPRIHNKVLISSLIVNISQDHIIVEDANEYAEKITIITMTVN